MMSTFVPNSIYRSQEAYNRVMALYDSVLSQWPVNYESSEVPTRYGQTEVVIAGPSDAPPLVLLHGAQVNLTTWLPHIAILSSKFRCYCIDIIGEGGKSAPTRLARKGQEHVDWLRDVLDWLKLDAVSLVGTSLGGWLALQTAAHAPDRVRCVVAISPVIFAPVRLQLALRGMPAILFPSRYTITALTRYIAAPHLPMDPGMVDMMLLLFKSIKANPYQPSTASDSLLRKITCPTLVMVGESEKFNNPQQIVERAKRLIPQVTTEIIAGAGHLLPAEQPDKVNDLTLRFLEQHAEK
ncbi:MAG: alpha/beta hydrolase [Chloroflexota bacterium]